MFSVCIMIMITIIIVLIIIIIITTSIHFMCVPSVGGASAAARHGAALGLDPGREEADRRSSVV